MSAFPNQVNFPRMCREGPQRAPRDGDPLVVGLGPVPPFIDGSYAALRPVDGDVRCAMQNLAWFELTVCGTE